MFTTIYQNEVAELNILNTPAPLNGDTREMNQYIKAFADKVARGYKAWESEVILKGSTPKEEASKFLASLKPWGKKDEAGKAAPRQKKPTGKNNRCNNSDDTAIFQ